MFIRQVKKQRSPQAKIFYQYNLVQSVRIDGKSRQRILLYLGSDKILADKQKRRHVANLLKARIFKQSDLLEEDLDAELVELADRYYAKYLAKYPEADQDDAPMEKRLSSPPKPAIAQYEEIDVNSVECSEVKTFGCEHLCAHVLQQLGLGSFFHQQGWSLEDQELALISIAARAIFCSSEYKTSQYLNTNSALIDCLSNQYQQISHKQLYRIADKLYDSRELIDPFLYDRVSQMFDLEDKLVIYDLSNTYFEGRKENSELCQFGRSKEKRNDCKQTVFTGVINPEGFIRHSRIYEGNMPDVKSVEDMLDDLVAHSDGNNDKVVVIDAGIATEENLALIASKEYKYICVARTTPDKYEELLSEERVVQSTDRGRSEVRLKILDTPIPEATKPPDEKVELEEQESQVEKIPDTWMYVSSQAKRLKEQSMSDKLSANFLEDLEGIRNSIHKKGGTKMLDKVWVRIGRLKEKYSSVAKNYIIEVTEQKPEQDQNPKSKKKKAKAKIKAADITWTKKPNTHEDHGVYFIRTNYQDLDEKQLWQAYNTIREVEATFRCLKSQLLIRPVYHQNDYRIKSHIYLTILAYQLVNTIRYMLKQRNINYEWKNIIRILSTHTTQTITLPTPSKTIYLRKPSRPIKEAKQIYQACNCPTKIATKTKYVVFH
jgi:transposase